MKLIKQRHFIRPYPESRPANFLARESKYFKNTYIVVKRYDTIGSCKYDAGDNLVGFFATESAAYEYLYKYLENKAFDLMEKATTYKKEYRRALKREQEK